MTKRPRIRLPQLERDGPIRNWSTLFEREPSRAGEAPFRDIVGLGYRVIDDFVESGRLAASRVRPPGAGPQHGGGGDAGLGFGVGAASDPSARMAELTSELVTIWLRVFEQTLRATAPRPAQPSEQPPPWEPPPRESPPREPPAHARAEPPARIELQISSARTTRVSVDLHPGADPAALIVPHLRPLDSDASTPPIPVRWQATPCARIEIAIADDQPAGRYNACIVDRDTGLPGGTLSLLILDGS